MRAVAVERLLALGGESAVEDGLSALHDPDPSVRSAAARALGEIADSHRDEGVRALAAIALGRKIGHVHE